MALQIQTLIYPQASLRSVRTAKREPTPIELSATYSSQSANYSNYRLLLNASTISTLRCGLTKKAEPPPNDDIRQPAASRQIQARVGGWLRRLVRPLVVMLDHHLSVL